MCVCRRSYLRSQLTAVTQPVLARVRVFLPELLAANTELAQRAQENPQSVDIEHVSPDSQQYIEMVSFVPSPSRSTAHLAAQNLGLGLFESRTHHDQQRPESQSSSGSSSSDGSESDTESEDELSYSSESDESDSNSEGSQPQTVTVVVRPIKPLPRRSKPPPAPLIEVLDPPSTSRSNSG